MTTSRLYLQDASCSGLSYQNVPEARLTAGMPRLLRETGTDLAFPSRSSNGSVAYARMFPYSSLTRTSEHSQRMNAHFAAIAWSEYLTA